MKVKQETQKARGSEDHFLYAPWGLCTIKEEWLLKVAGVDSDATNRKLLKQVVQKWRYLSWY